MKRDRLAPKAIALACLLAVLVVFALEGTPHRHASASGDRTCPACQAARQHVGDAPRSDGALLAPPASRRALPAGPAIERIVLPHLASSASPRSPPSLSS